MAGYTPPPCGPYQYNEVLSALRKEIKLDNPAAAIYWANVILTHVEKSAQKTLAKQLWVMSAEDINDPPLILRAYAVYQMAGVVPETDQLLYLVYAMCKAEKFWETDPGREADRLWAQAIGDLKDPDRMRPIPSYALDRHTGRGWSIFKRTGKFDDRFTGTDLGRQKTVFLFLRDGYISAESVLDDQDPDFLAHWQAFRRLSSMTASNLEPNDPLGPKGLSSQQSGMLLDIEGPQVNDRT